MSAADVTDTGPSGADGTATDPFVAARTVADAVLYEGYVLYPYRASARKNQLRWQFGVLAPPAYAAAEGSERSSMRTEVVADPGGDARVRVRIRCLQVQHRSVEAAHAGRDLHAGGGGRRRRRPVGALGRGGGARARRGRAAAPAGDATNRTRRPSSSTPATAPSC